MNSISHRLKPYLGYALYFGLFVLVGGYFITPESSKYHTQIYLGLYIPALIAVIVNAATPYSAIYKNDPVLQSFTALLLWLAITTLWSGYDNTAHLLKLI